MNILNIIKTEFIKNFNLKKIICILILLIISSIIYVEINDYFSKSNRLGISENIYLNIDDDLEKVEESYKNNQNKDIYKIILKLNELSKYIKNDNNWQLSALSQYRIYYTKQLALENINNKYNIKENYYPINNSPLILSIQTSYKNIIENIKLSNEELNNEISKLKEQNNKLESVIKLNKYYMYVDLTLDMFDSYRDEQINDINKYIIDNKIEDENDINVLMITNKYLVKNKIDLLNSNTNGYELKLYGTNYNKYKNLLIDKYNDELLILDYSLKNNISNDITHEFNDDYINIQNTKTSSNIALSMTPIILLIVALTSGGIVSKEHEKGTIKQLLIKPVKRWKILLGKMLYLIIYTYILWIILTIIILIISSFKYGINDLFINKLIVKDNKVIEINYFIWLIKEMIMEFPTMLPFITIIFCLSTITLNTTFTSSISSIIAILSQLTVKIKYIIEESFVNKIAYTFIPYLDISWIRNNSIDYIELKTLTNINYPTIMILCILFSITLYIITNIIYIKRNIKSN